MNKAKCDKDKHFWICKEKSGFLNEITTFRPLTSEPACPQEAIACSRCGEYLNNDKPQTDLSEKLKSIKIKF
jgi:hypothetical protein